MLTLNIFIKKLMGKGKEMLFGGYILMVCWKRALGKLKS